MSRNRIRFGAPSKRQSRQSIPDDFEAEIESLSLEGRGIARISGKTCFVAGALPGERVKASITARHKRYDEALVEQVLVASDERRTPPCQYYDRCGGCQLQHLDPERQLAYKQSQLLDQLKRFAGIEPLAVETALTSAELGYRRTARIGINQRADGEVLIGFRRQASNKLLDIEQCPVLDARINALLVTLRDALSGLGDIKHLTHLDIACGETSSALTVRVTRKLSQPQSDAIARACEAHEFQFYVEANNGQISAAGDTAAALSYRLPEQNLDLGFAPGDFLQVNAEINRQMVERALDWLSPKQDDRVLDLFCGLGNFTLPLARHAGRVVGVEGSAAMVERARENAQRNELENAEFYKGDLSSDIRESYWYRESRQNGFDVVLLDPPRAGAEACVRELADYGARAVLYISCNPAALVRDAELLKDAGYRMTRFSVMDMFPNTAHVESMALFEC
ncbi:23S rRNA (uracil(1939)-C(5))-methyltransferase RlmD [Marinobacterium lutimaris]|uniref:23S rRNA (uracil(1939)-C(5))-methyltransferase RlmD n=1 Tax=Marinobacterium lutimaris TaxID=568106 RepID=A0A1H5WQ03_9GAMM|nr:23S rRNA (uracil(1939)-C(5))-methyltransferase RlmD [Marinobacterium lutimaris]SEG01047.1 23S rRNA m(5)U-1939 methyltransferase [Marinobacterium lutimaris]